MMGIRAPAPDWNIVLSHMDTYGVFRRRSDLFAIYQFAMQSSVTISVVVEHDASSSSRFCRLEVGAIPQHGASYTNGLVGQSHRRHIRMTALCEFRNPAT